MAQKAYGGVSNVARNGIKLYGGVNGVARNVIKGYVGDENGIARQFWGASQSKWVQIDNSPIDGYLGSAVVYNNKIHLFNGTDHYSFDGTTWTQESILPKTVYSPIAVVYRNKIYLLDNGTGRLGFYAWDGFSWVQKSTTGLNMILYGMNNGCVYNDKLTIISSRYSGSGFFRRIWQYDFQAETWTNVRAAYINNESGSYSHSCCVYDGKVEYVNSGNTSRRHLAWAGSDIIELTDMPYTFINGFMLEFQGKIHFIGSNAYGNNSYNRLDTRKFHYSWDGTQYEEVATLLYYTYDCPAVVYNNKIYCFGCPSSNAHNYVAVYETSPSPVGLKKIESAMYPNANVFNAGVVSENNGGQESCD